MNVVGARRRRASRSADGPRGGVSMTLMSRTPDSAMWSVRGIGVAVSVSTSTSVRICLMRSLCFTPKRCSSSMTTSPRSLNCTSFCSRRCVPMTTSTSPVASCATTSRCSAGVRKRDSISTRTGKRGEPLAEGLEVLLREHGRRHEHRDLLAVLHRLERGAHRDLGLAVADVADDETVHRPRALHVALAVVDRRELVRRLGEGERVLHLDLPRRVLPERVRADGLARRVQAEQLARDLLDRLLRLALRRRPVLAAERGQRRRRPADVARDPVDALGRQRDDVGARETQLEVLAHDAGDLARDEALEPRDAVVLVHDVVARLAGPIGRSRPQRGGGGARDDAACGSRRPRRP